MKFHCNAWVKKEVQSRLHRFHQETSGYEDPPDSRERW